MSTLNINRMIKKLTTEKKIPKSNNSKSNHNVENDNKLREKIKYMNNDQELNLYSTQLRQNLINYCHKL